MQQLQQNCTTTAVRLLKQLLVLQIANYNNNLLVATAVQCFASRNKTPGYP
jgi:hypothetical protein